MRLVALLALALLACAPARAGTADAGNVAFGLGTTAGKTAVWVSSTVTTTAIGTIVASSRTVTNAKTFYLQHLDISMFMNSQSTGTINLASVQISSNSQGANAVVIASRTFVNAASQVATAWQLDFTEPMPFAANSSLFVKILTNVTTQLITTSNAAGYEK